MKDLLLILLPGSMYFWTLFIGQGPFQEIVQEKESHILPRMLASPVTPGQYVLAKMLRCFVLCAATLILLLAATSLVFGVSWGSPLQLALVIAIWALSMAALLSLIHGISRTREQAQVLSPMVLLLFAMLGGSMLPFESLPPFLQSIGQFSPNRWAVLTLKGVADVKPFGSLFVPLASLAALGVLGLALGFVLLIRRLAKGGAR